MNNIPISAMILFLLIMLGTHSQIDVDSIIPKVYADTKAVNHSPTNGIPSVQRPPYVKGEFTTAFATIPSDRQVIKLIAHQFPPYQYKKNGKIDGPIPKLMDLVCKKAGLDCVMGMRGFREAYGMAETGDADVIFTFLIEAGPERESKFSLSPPIALTTYSFFTTSTSNWSWTGDHKELDGRTVGAYGPSGTWIIATNLLARNRSAILVQEDTNLKVFQNLVLGKYGPKSSVITTKEVALSFLKNSNINGPKPAGDILQANLGFGFSKASPNLKYAPDMFKALNELKADGTVAKILSSADEPLKASK